MDSKLLQSTIEAILFAAGDPVPIERIAAVCGVTDDEIIAESKVLADYYSFNSRGICLVRMEDKLQLCSAAGFADEIVHVLEKRRPPKLSQPALEVLAICAYFQPVTRAYVEQVRGVDSSYTMGMLLERGLIESCGRLDVPGRPSIYKTTDLFLRTMGITNLTELPQLPDINSPDGESKLGGVIEALKAQENGQLTIENSEG